MATINTDGIKIKTLGEWKALLEAIYIGVDAEWDISTNTPDGQIIAALAEMLANADEALLDSYNAADPDKARKEALDAIMRLSGAERVGGTFSTATVQLSGINTTLVEAGTIIENVVTGTKWSVDTDTVIGVGATNTAITCTTIGAQTAGIGELTKIATPVNGLQSVTNASAATPGRNEMTDPEARLFRSETISNPACNNIDSIHSAVASVVGVTNVATYNNRNAVPDTNGLPANSFAVIVQGGTDADVARAIYGKLPPGPAMFGGSNPVTINVLSTTTANSENITFGRPTLVPLYIRVNITETGNFDDSASDKIKQAIIDFSLGNLFDSDSIAGYTKRGFRIGEDISSGMIHTPVNYCVGQSGQGFVTTINIATTPSPASPGTVPINWQSLATVAAANIDVVIT